MPSLLNVRLSLKGRPVRTYTFEKPTISIGRNPAADMFLDNTGISREHAMIDCSRGGFILEDLGSANGTFLNDMAVTREVLGHDDVVRIGKFTLWVGLEGDRRDGLLAQAPLSPQTFEGTTILSAEQMVDLTRKAKVEEKQERWVAPARPRTWPLTRASFVISVIAALFFGLFIGVASALHFLR
jgi:pSer/pThr/pTyr-binding forkhead associated (FHA) protein